MSSVLLFSGGMDSFCLLKKQPYDKILFFMTGTKDNICELRQVYQMQRDKIIDPKKLVVVNLPLLTWELPNKIIPHRNTIMCLVASNYGSDIYIGATKGDTTKDKDYVFKSQVESIMNYFGQDSQKVPSVGYPYRILMPLKNMTKTEILNEYIANGNSIPNLLKYSRSCYLNDDSECGTCRSCLRKAVAFKNNDIDYSGIFRVDPLSRKLSEAEIAKMKSRPSEWEDYQKATTHA